MPMPMAETPVSLLDRLREQPDRDTWRRWFDLYRPLLQHWLGPYRLQPSDADDVAQEVLVTVVAKLPEFRHEGRTGSFRCWLRGVMVNRLREFFRDRRLHAATDAVDRDKLLDEMVDPDSQLSRLWDREHDEWVLRRLMELIRPEFEPTTWEAFRGLVVEGRADDDVAASLGLSVNAVRVAKSRVLRRLREEAAGLVD